MGYSLHRLWSRIELIVDSGLGLEWNDEALPDDSDQAGQQLHVWTFEI